MKLKLINLLFGLFLIFLFPINGVFADTTGSISGKVLNHNQAGIPFVLIRWIDGRFNGNNRFVLTDENGYFNFRDNYYGLTNGGYFGASCNANSCPMDCPVSRLTFCIDYYQKLSDYIFFKKQASYFLRQLPSNIQKEILTFMTCEEKHDGTPSGEIRSLNCLTNPELPKKIVDLPSDLPISIKTKVIDYFKYEQPVKDYQILSDPKIDIRTASTIIGDKKDDWWAWQCGVTHTVYAYPQNYSESGIHIFGPYEFAMNNGSYQTFTIGPGSCIPDGTCGTNCIYDINAEAPNDGTCYSANCPGRISFCKVPTPYPTIHIKGDLKEDLTSIENSCNNPLSINRIGGDFLILLNSSKRGFSSTCITTSSDKYSCDLTLDNQYSSYDEPEVDPIHDVFLSTSTILNSTSYWGKKDSSCVYNCSDSSSIYQNCGESENTTINFESSSTSQINRNIFVKRNDLGTKEWIKFKDASFFGKSSFSGLNNIPQNVHKYNFFGESDLDDDQNPYFITGEGGMVTSFNLINLGSINNQAKFSMNNWYVSDYHYSERFNSYIDFYNFSLKNTPNIYQEISSINLIETIRDKSIFFYSDPNFVKKDLIINQEVLSKLNKKLILVVNGSVSFDLGENSKFDPANTIMIIADNINFYKDYSTSDSRYLGIVGYAKGVFVADKMDTGRSEKPLKIKGNVTILNKDQTLNKQRKNLDNTMPSIFVVFDTKQYLDLIPLLTIKSYEWIIQE